MLFAEWRRAYYWLLCCVTCKRPKDRDEAEETPVSIFANDADRREFICAGAAAGIAVGSPSPSFTACWSHLQTLPEDAEWIMTQHNGRVVPFFSIISLYSLLAF